MRLNCLFNHTARAIEGPSPDPGILYGQISWISLNIIEILLPNNNFSQFLFSRHKGFHWIINLLGDGKPKQLDRTSVKGNCWQSWLYYLTFFYFYEKTMQLFEITFSCMFMDFVWMFESMFERMFERMGLTYLICANFDVDYIASIDIYGFHRYEFISTEMAYKAWDWNILTRNARLYRQLFLADLNLRHFICWRQNWNSPTLPYRGRHGCARTIKKSKIHRNGHKEQV